MFQQLNDALSGKKSYFIATWAFCGALYMWMNGIGDAESQAILGTVAAGLATLRAGITKNGAAVLIVAVTAGFFLTGCASLGVVDPATGTSPAQDIVTSVGEVASLFGPVAGTAVPIGIASLLSILIALGKVKKPTE